MLGLAVESRTGQMHKFESGQRPRGLTRNGCSEESDGDVRKESSGLPSSAPVKIFAKPKAGIGSLGNVMSRRWVNRNTGNGIASAVEV